MMIAAVMIAHTLLVATDTPAPWTSSTSIRVRPELQEGFEQTLRELISAHQRAGAPWFLTFETFAGDTSEYTIVAPVQDFASLEARSPEFDRLERLLFRYATAQVHEYATPRSDAEIRRADVPLSSYWIETRSRIAAGRMSEYVAWLKNDYRPALLKAGVAHFRVSQPIFGAESGEIVTMRMLESLKEIDRGAVLSRALSDDEARVITSKVAAVVVSSHTRIVRLRSDLSYSLRPEAILDRRSN
jgi:hypothetical protein